MTNNVSSFKQKLTTLFITILIVIAGSAFFITSLGQAAAQHNQQVLQEQAAITQAAHKLNKK